MLRFVAGFITGLILGAAAVLLTTPQSGPDLQSGARTWLEDILNQGRQAAEQRRIELESRVANFTLGR
ncbi:MAG TPA: YtxH domain-containing protein [Anaerolineae bacterium]|nr:YtxH domain-containing protein [Anaerolineae bacterium]HMR67756.1 YtxH domain-containing protein [Anaerolineae bacterium]